MTESWERHYRATGPVARGLGRYIFGMRVIGAESIPNGPFVAAINHLSHVDAVFAATAIRPPMRFMAAADLIGVNRGMDFFLPFYGAILLPRTGVPLGALRTGLHHLADGGALCVFPEGRRSEGWRHTNFKRGAAWLSLRSGVPLVPVALKGTEKVMGLDRQRLSRAHVEVRIGAPIAPIGDPSSLTERWAADMDSLLGHKIAM